jgi:uncharacterized membrane protein (DUF4010 family)
VAGLSFVGYVAIRIAGARVGTLVTGLLGGLASSTATTLAFSRMARRAEGLGPLLAVGVVLAGSVTFLRIVVLASVFNRSLFVPLAVPMVAMSVVGLAGAGVLWRMAPSRGESPGVREIANPLELGMALRFGAFLAVVAVATRYFQDWFGTAGVYAVAALSGITDVDAVTISVARMAHTDLASAAATGAIVTAASVNTVIKGGMALVVGGQRVGWRVIAVYVAVLAAGGLAVWLG